MKKVYKTAPLPFQGQKRIFIKHFIKALDDYPSDGLYVDLFGGSGLLSHNVKNKYPNATVVYNDYDNYSKRLASIPKTNRILQELRGLSLTSERKSKIEGYERELVTNMLLRHNQEGYVDWITLSTNLLFSMNYALSYQEFVKQGFYNRVRTMDYPDAQDYLKGINVVNVDYKVLFDKYKNSDVIFLVDPPYLSTDTSTYKSNDYWKLRDYLDVLNLLHGHSYFYFTSNKSQIVELCEWIETKSTSNANPFSGSKRVTTTNRTTHNTGYTDIMYHLKR